MSFMDEILEEVGEELFATLLDDEARFAQLVYGTPLGTRLHPCETPEEAESVMRAIDSMPPEEKESARRRAIDVLWAEVGKYRVSALVHYLRRVSEHDGPGDAGLVCIKKKLDS